MTELVVSWVGQWSLKTDLRRLWRLLRVAVHILWGLCLALRYGRSTFPADRRVMLLARNWLRDLLHILGVEVRVHGRVPREPVMMVSNHVSWLDIPVIGALQGAHFLSKAEVRQWPLIGWLAVAAGTVFIRRGSGDSRQRTADMVELLKDDRPVLVFPEGTTTAGLLVRRFHSRLFEAAIQAQVAVQPVAIRYHDEHGRADVSLAFIGDDAFFPHLWRLLARRRTRVSLWLPEPIEFAAGATRVELCDRARERVVQALY